MADMTTIKGRIAETIYPNGKGAITAEKHQALLLEMVDDINAKKADKEEVTAVAESVSTLSQEVESNRVNLTESINALEQKVDNLPQGEEFDAEGNYPSLRVGTADTAIDLAGRGESVPASFGFRASGGKSIKDGRAYIKRIKGNSVVWNQLFDIHAADRSYNENGVHITDNRDGSYTISTDDAGSTQRVSRSISVTHSLNIAGHKLLITGCDGAKDGFGFWDSFSNTIGTIFKNNTIVTASGNGLTAFSIIINESVIVPQTTWKPRVYDLTQLFQAGNEPTTIEEFYARVATLGVDMNAYNEGQVIHCNTESIKSVGDNAWDEEWELGSINRTSGANVSSSSRIRSKNYIRVIPNTDYYLQAKADIYICYYDSEMNFIKADSSATRQGSFTTDGNIYFIRFFVVDTTTYNNDIMITLVHSGWKQDTDAGYQPYWQDTLPLPIISTYFPDGMKSAGSAHDEIRYNKASGKWEYSKGKIKSVDLGTLSYTIGGSGDTQFFYTEVIGKRTNPMNGESSKLLCGVYTTGMVAYYSQEKADMTIYESYSSGQGSVVYIKNSAYTDAATFKAAMQGVILYYESNDWEWVELDAEDQNFRDYYNVADFGTEQSQSSVPSAAFSADIIYQFNAVDMIREHEIEINELQSIIATMQAQLTSLINGGQ